MEMVTTSASIARRFLDGEGLYLTVVEENVVMVG